MFDWCAYMAVRGLFGILGLLPHWMRVGLFASLWRLAFFVLPRLRRTALINLKIAFPDSNESWRREILRKNAVEMGRLLADTIRLSALDEEWAEKHVEIPALEEYAQALKSSGVLIATGHLGSFELLGHAIGLRGYPLSAVARRFKSPRLDAWWQSLREARGNRIIDRTGAFKEVVKEIFRGRSAALLIDQNVKSNHAVFVDWFGEPAATTRAFALAALKTRAPVFVAGMVYGGSDKYRVEAVQCDFAGVYDDQTLSDAEKILRITETFSKIYCDMIRRFPEGWFWIHRRWKTRPEGEREDVYRP
jgi:KDO2-lipid IV(A) lauroyltransferase